jgi:hypothetical protein
VLHRAGLEPGERVLAGTVSRDGVWLLGTRDALILVPPGADRAPHGEPSTPTGPTAAPAANRIPWERVERADWEREDDRLRIVEVGEFGKVRPQHSYHVDNPGVFVPLLRERVTASVVLQRRVVVSGRKGLFVIARRPPRGTGEITWAFEFDPGVDPEDPEVTRLAQEGLRAAAEELGL